MQFNFSKSRMMLGITGGIVALLLATGAPALAESPAQTTTPPPEPAIAAPDYRFLEREYKHLNNWLNVQQQRLDYAVQFGGMVQTYITEQTSAGKDTSALEAALATFNSQIAAAQTSHDTAASVLSAHSGFDANGQVTDRAQARLTVRDAHRALSDARRIKRRAYWDIGVALRSFWRANNLPAMLQVPQE